MWANSEAILYLGVPDSLTVSAMDPNIYLDLEYFDEENRRLRRCTPNNPLDWDKLFQGERRAGNTTILTETRTDFLGGHGLTVEVKYWEQLFRHDRSGIGKSAGYGVCSDFGELPWLLRSRQLCTFA
jgi:hypothetical protein